MVHTDFALGLSYPGDSRFWRLGMGCSVLAIAAVFGLDWFIPPGIDIPVLYAVILVTSLAWATPAQAVIIAAVASLLTVAGFVHPHPAEMVPDGVNRVITLLILWFVAYYGFAYRKAIAQTLREREQILRITFDAAPVGINVVDLGRRFLKANAAYQRLVGYTEEELRGMTTFELNHPDDTPRNWTFRQELLEGRRNTYAIEKRYRTKSGDCVWVRNSVSLVRDAGGKPAFTIAVCEDITERKRTERDLERQAALTRLLGTLAALANKSDDSEQALAACLERICEHGGWHFGNVLQITRDGDSWWASGTQQYFADARFRDRLDSFIALCEQTRQFSAHGVFIGRATSERAPQWIASLNSFGYAARLTAAREVGVRSAFVFPLIVRDEVVACVEFFAMEVREPDEAFIAAASDIASHLARVMERERATRAQAHLAAIVETSPDAIVTRTLNGTILSWNRGAERMFDYKAAEVLGKDIQEIIPEENIEETRRNRQLVNAANTLPQLETVRFSRNGRRLDILLSAAPIMDVAGGVSAVAMIMHDITERKTAEHALRRSEAQFLKIFRTSPIAISISSVHDGRIIDVNDRYVELFGYRRAELLGRTRSELSLWVDKEQRARLVKDLLAGQPVHNVEAQFRRKSGETVTALYSRELLQLDDQPVSFTMRVDITERKAAETKLRAYANELQALSRRLADLQETERRQLSRELHDRVGQYLTALNINLDIVRSQLSPASVGRVASRIEDSVRLVESTMDAVDNLMSGLRPPMLDDLGLLAALKWHASEFEKRTGIVTTMTRTGPALRMSAAVELTLFRIAQEALTNIAKHAHARTVRIAVHVGGMSVWLDIIDDGKGFDPMATFGSADPPHWGLMSMRERARAMGGAVRIESMPGSGTHLAAEVQRLA